jgi:hypothetical protein
VKHGVPQGLILGPLFFLLYINYLSKIISDKSNLVLFADDTVLLLQILISWHLGIILMKSLGK